MLEYGSDFYRLLKLFVILCKFIVDNFCGDKFVGSFHLLGISSVFVDFRKMKLQFYWFAGKLQ